MADNDYPSWLQSLPTLPPVAPPEPGNWAKAGMLTGINNMFGAFGGAARAVGDVVGSQGLSDFGKSVADNRREMAAQTQRPDLESASWFNPAKVGYELAKAVPSMAGLIGAGALAGEVLPAAAAGGLAARVGAAVPAWLGGGAQFVPRVAGLTAAGLPQSIGGNVEEYTQSHGGELGRGPALAAIGLGIPEAAVGALGPASFHAPIEGDGFKRLLTGARQGATVNAPAAAVQAGLTSSMDPDKSVTDRARDVVDAALGGAVVGGAFGGAMRIYQRKAPQEIANNPKDLDQATAGASLSQEQTPPPDPAAQQAAQTAADAQTAAVARGPTPNAETRDLMGAFGQLPEAELRQRAETLATKERTPTEDIQHGLLMNEIADRTPPGGDADQHALFTPEEMGARKQLADEYGDALAEKYKGLPEGLTKGVTSDAEMVNQLNRDLPSMGKKPPEAVRQLADDLGVGKTPIAERVAEQQAVATDLFDKASDQLKRNPGEGKRLFEQGQEAQKQLKELQRLQAIHEEAAGLLKAREEPPVEAAPTEAAAPAETATAAPAGEQSPLPEPPEMSPAIQKHWDAMANLFELARDGQDYETAGKALDALNAFSAGKTRSGIAKAVQLREVHDALREQSAGEVDVRNPPADGEAVGGGHTEGDAVAAQEEAEHPAIQDGSKLAWNTPEAEPVVGVKQPFQARPIPVGLAADRQAEVQKGLRDEARSRLTDPDTSDAEKDRITSALQKADAGSHSALAETLNALDKARAVKQPEGPWQGTDEKVVGTPSVQPKVVGVVGSLMRALGLGNIRTMVLHPDDVLGAGGKALGLNGDYAAAKQSADLVQAAPNHQGHVFQFGPGNKDFAMYVKPGSDADMLTAAGHEVGHVAEKVLLNNAPKRTQDAIHKAFLLELKRGGMKGQDLARLDRSSPEYAEQFSEWFADNTERWFRAGANGEPPVARSAVDQFFKKVADKWRDVVSAITGDPLPPNEKVAAFLDSAVNSNRAVKWMGDADNKVRFKLASGKPETVPEINEAVGSAVRGGLEAGERLVQAALDRTTNQRGFLRRNVALYAAPTDLIWKQMAKFGSQAAEKFYAITQTRQGRSDAWLKPLIRTTDAYHALPRAEQERVHLFKEAVAAGIDPRKSFADQPGLHDLSNSGVLKEAADKAYADYRWTRQNAPAATKVIDAFLTAGRVEKYGETLASMMNLVEKQSRGVKIPGVDYDFFNRAQFDDAMHGDINVAHDKTQAAFASTVEALKAHVGQTNDAVEALKAQAAAAKKAGDPDTANTLTQQATSTKRSVDGIKLALQQASDAEKALTAPYFHKGRTGDYMVSANLPKVGENVDPVALEKFQTRLQNAGFGDYAIMQEINNPKVYMRVDSESQHNSLTKLFQEARAAGELHAKSDIVHGNIDDLNTLHSLMPSDIRDMIERMHSVDVVAPAGADENVLSAMESVKRQMIADTERSYLNQMSSNALPKMLTRVQDVQGFSKNWGRSMAQRMSASARAIGTLSTQAEKSEALGSLRDEVQARKRIAPGQTVDPADAVKFQDYAAEMMLRESQRAYEVPSNPLSVLGRMAHVFSIGFSPAYVLTLTSQLATLVQPELAKTHGNLAAAKSMAGVAADVIKTIRASLDLKTGRFTIDPENMRAAGVSEKFIKAATRLDNEGKLTPSLTQLNQKMAEGDHGALLHRLSTLMGYTAEIMPKLFSLYAAHDLYDLRAVKGMTKEQFASKVTDESNMDYGYGSQPRALGQHGVFGSYSPLALQFQGFHARLLGKYYREFYDLTKGDKETRGQAQTWLLGHVAAITVLAGSMGLPAAGLFANVFDKVANAVTGRDDYDIEAAYRGFLAQTFGKSVGEVLAKGLPRAGGVDLSHLGEQHIVPLLSELVFNKRKFEDARGDYLERLGGPALGEVGDLVLGGRDLLNGFYQQGLEKLLPGELKNLAKSYHMTTRGYEDQNGLTLPMTPRVQDILMRAVGVQNATLAEYNDEKETMGDLMAQRTYRQQNITRHIELGINHEDPAQLQAALQEATQFTMDHPGLPSPLTHVGTNVEKFSKKGATARGLGMVLGQKPADIGLGAQLGYGNWRP